MSYRFDYERFNEDTEEYDDLIVDYDIRGSYRSATWDDPAEYPEVEINGVATKEGTKVELSPKELSDLEVSILEQHEDIGAPEYEYEDRFS